MSDKLSSKHSKPLTAHRPSESKKLKQSQKFDIGKNVSEDNVVDYIRNHGSTTATKLIDHLRLPPKKSVRENFLKWLKNIKTITTTLEERQGSKTTVISLAE